MGLEEKPELVTNVATYQIDDLGVVRRWNQGAVGLLGHNADEIIGQSAQEFSVSRSDLNAAESASRAMREGSSVTAGFVVRKDGTKFWALEITVPCVFDQKECRLTRVVSDLTHWKRAGDERDRFFTMTEDLLCIARFDGFFTRVSASFSRVLGYSESELLQKPFADFVHPDDVPATSSAAAQLSADDQSQTFRNRYRHRDGSYRWLEWMSTSVSQDQLIYAVARDITDQRATEEKLKLHAIELERSNRDLQQFAYVASHDLQEPLRAVVGCVQMLEGRLVGTLDARSTELMHHAVEGAKRMQTLINDLLSYSRVGSKGVTKSWGNARLLLDKACKQLATAIAESNAVLEIAQLPKVWADPVQITQLFQNLIGNAIKFRRSEPPRIRIEATASGNTTTFSVIDNGIGIAAEYRERVFGLFQRLHSREMFEGTGIGLAICKKVVERHGGRIWIDPSDEGTIIRFTIQGVQ